MKVRATWTGDYPLPGQFFMSTRRPKYLYAIVGVRVLQPARVSEPARLELDAERIPISSCPELPSDAVIWEWKWTSRAPKFGVKIGQQ